MKVIRVKARVVKNPCRYIESCHAACVRCETHNYSEACVPLLQQTIQRQESMIIKRDDQIMWLKYKCGIEAGCGGVW